jgi:hypothetical protein
MLKWLFRFGFEMNPINIRLILSGPTGIAVSGGDLFVANANADGTIREYTISGALDSVDESTTR